MLTVIRGAVKAYDWGVVDGLAQWCGGKTGQPQAELWFGMHPSGPSPIVPSVGDLARISGNHDGRFNDGRFSDERRLFLGDVLDAHQVPLLVKLLAAAQPLSVQVHPRAALAQERWRIQQSAGGMQILADDNEKTELIVALEPFEAFVGWRPVSEAASMLAYLQVAPDAVVHLSAGDRISAIRSLHAARGVEGAVSMLPAAAREAGLPPRECSAYETVAAMYPGDGGALLTALLAYVHLSAGSAIYVPAGVPHSYIRGLGLEVMTTSDNVLRLGLTTKPVFVEEAIGALELDAVPLVMRSAFGELIAPVGAPFEVLLGRGLSGGAGMSVQGGATGRAEGSQQSFANGILGQGKYRLCLAIDGVAEISTDSGSVILTAGSAAVISREESAATVSSTGLIALVSDCGFSRSGSTTS